MRLFEHPDFDQVILQAAEHFQLRPGIIEKDYYVTEVLRIIAATAGDKVIFKGGTSLSKGWNLIQRFSEDIDLFLDPLAFEPPLAPRGIDRELKRLRDAVAAHPALQFVPEESRTIGGFGRNDRFSYHQLHGGPGEVANRVLLEAGAASGRECGKTKNRRVRCLLRPVVLRVGEAMPHYNVMFLCTGNSARSIMAEAIMNRKGREHFTAYSAGSHPTGQVRPEALKQIEKAGLSIANARSKSWDEFSKPESPPLHFVFTVCDNAASEVCPLWPGQPMTAHWGIPDPAAASGTTQEVERAFSQAFASLDRRISLFLSLPIGTLDTFALQYELDSIGKK